MGWAEQEFETIDLGDPRLNRRAVLLVERLGHKPGASIPGACENWAETAAAYRFLRDEQVSCEDVMTAHRQAPMGHIREHAVVLCLQDTTELDFNGQEASGLGPLGYKAQRGLYLHPIVPLKSAKQQAVLALHRACQGFVKARTAQANQIRGLLAEYGIIIPQGIKPQALRCRRSPATQFHRKSVPIAQAIQLPHF